MRIYFSTEVSGLGHFFVAWVMVLSVCLAPKVSANEETTNKIAEVVSLLGGAGVAGEPRRHELTASSVLFADKLVMLDRGAVLVIRYAATQACTNCTAPGWWSCSATVR